MVSTHDAVKPWAQYNIELNRFHAAMGVADSGQSPTQLQEQIRSFMDFCQTLPQSVVDRAQVQSLLEGLEPLASSEQSSGPAVGDLSKVGPRSSPLWNEDAWQEEIAPDQSWIRYDWAYNKKTKHQLMFIRVKSSGSSPGSFYLCTTEVSIGLFNNILGKAKRWNEFVDLLGDPQWTGPKVWKWRSTSKKAKGIKKATGGPIPIRYSNPAQDLTRITLDPMIRASQTMLNRCSSFHLRQPVTWHN